MKTETALAQVLTKLNKDRDQLEEIASAHEGVALLEDELHHLREKIRHGERPVTLRENAKRVAVMAMRIMTDCT